MSLPPQMRTDQQRATAWLESPNLVVNWRAEKQFWARWTSSTGLYYWLHPTELRWVGEPDQIGMPDFPSRGAALIGLAKAPPPPN